MSAIDPKQRSLEMQDYDQNNRSFSFASLGDKVVQPSMKYEVHAPLISTRRKKNSHKKSCCESWGRGWTNLSFEKKCCYIVTCPFLLTIMITLGLILGPCADPKVHRSFVGYDCDRLRSSNDSFPDNNSSFILMTTKINSVFSRQFNDVESFELYKPIARDDLV